MTNATVRALAGALIGSGWLMAACASDESHPAPRASGGQPAAGGSAASRGGGLQGGAGAEATGGRSSAGQAGRTGGAGPGSGGQNDAGNTGSDAGAGAGQGDAGSGGVPPDITRCPSDDQLEPAPELGSLCDPSLTWGDGKPVLTMGGDADQLIAITPDELTLVWFDARGAAGSFRLADRPDRGAAFAVDGAPAPRDVIAISPDGLRLVGFSEDQSALVEYVRNDRGETFGAGSEGAFAALNADARQNGYQVLDVTIAPDDRTLYYDVTISEDGGYPLRVSRRTGAAPWPVGEVVELCEFKGFGGQVRHPTAVSADGLTLFYYDPLRAVARAAYRVNRDAPFTWFVDLGERYQATMSEGCERVYYSGSMPDGAGTALFVAEGR